MKQYSFLLLEDTIGIFSGKLEYKIEVFPDDKGSIPHFHITNKNKNFDTCIEICDNRYFRHGAHKDSLTSIRDRKLLQKFLLDRPVSKKGYHYGTNWKYIVAMWNQCERSIKVPSNQKMPDYTTIKQERKSK